MLIALDLPALRALKREVSLIYPHVKSALLSEALARGLGFENNSILMSRLAEAWSKETPRYLAFADDGALIGHLMDKGALRRRERPIPVYGGLWSTTGKERPLLQAALHVDGGGRIVPESQGEVILKNLSGRIRDNREEARGHRDLAFLFQAMLNMKDAEIAIPDMQVDVWLSGTPPVRRGWTNGPDAVSILLWPYDAQVIHVECHEGAIPWHAITSTRSLDNVSYAHCISLLDEPGTGPKARISNLLAEIAMQPMVDIKPGIRLHGYRNPASMRRDLYVGFTEEDRIASAQDPEGSMPPGPRP